jgi:hypothetical protein
MADISKKLDKKVRQMEIGSILGDLAVASNKLKDQMNKKDKLKAAQGLRMGGRAGYKSGSKGCKLAMKGKGRAYGKNS